MFYVYVEMIEFYVNESQVACVKWRCELTH